MIEITLNGQTHTLTAPQSLRDLLTALGYPFDTIAVAVNQKIIPRTAYASTMINKADQLEVLGAMQGG